MQTPATASSLVPYQAQTLRCWKGNFIFHCINYAHILFGQKYGNPIPLLEFCLQFVNLIFMFTVQSRWWINMKWVGWRKGLETLAISFIGYLICNYKVCTVLLNLIKMQGVHVYHICVGRSWYYIWTLSACWIFRTQVSKLSDIRLNLFIWLL